MMKTAFCAAAALACMASVAVAVPTDMETCVGPKCVTTTNAEKLDLFRAHRARNTYAQSFPQQGNLDIAMADIYAQNDPNEFGSIRGFSACEDGSSAGFECRNIDMLSFLTLEELHIDAGESPNYSNDLWGYEDPETGVDWIVMTLSGGTVFVDITDPEDPKVMGYLPLGGPQSSGARDVKMYGQYMYQILDRLTVDEQHVSIFDMHELRNQTDYKVYEATAFYEDLVNNCHNIVINEDTGTMLLAYSIQTDSLPDQLGFQVVSLEDPLKPVFKSHVPNVGIVHDGQCIIYNGPDTEFQGKEICATFNINSCAIWDMTDLTAPALISIFTYPGVTGSHQGWFTDDHGYMLHNDELDGPYASAGFNPYTGAAEAGVAGTRVFLWDVRLLRAPILIGIEDSRVENHNDHNLHIRGDQLAFHAQYAHGLAVLDVSQVASAASAPEVGYFDCWPIPMNPATGHITNDGAWTAYPYNTKGVVALSCRATGLFLLKVQDDIIPKTPKVPAEPRPADFKMPKFNSPLEPKRAEQYPLSCAGFCGQHVNSRSPSGCYCDPSCLTGGLGGGCCPDYVDVCASVSSLFLEDRTLPVDVANAANSNGNNANANANDNDNAQGFTAAQVAGVAAGSVIAAVGATALTSWAVVRHMNQRKEQHLANVGQIEAQSV